jgi:exonuclease-1
MGISELLRKLGPITTGKHISEFANKTAAIDIMNWLYKGLYACAAQQSPEAKSDLYLNYPLKMLALLKAHSITPIVVFDGKTLKEKQKIEEGRKEARESNIQKATYLKNAGNEDESRKFFRRSLKVKSRMLNSLIEILKQMDIKVIVAPYEADSQLAYLVRKKYADFAISEDSDLIALGVRDVVMKLTPEGSCMNVNMEAFWGSAMESHSDKLIRDIKAMSYVNFLELVVMSGCDYLPSIKGFGLKTGLALFEKYKKMEAVFHEMKFIEKFKSKIPENYLENAKKSVCMFFYQTVFDPEENKLVSLNSHDFEECDNLERTYTKDYLNKFVSELLYKRNLNENGTQNDKSKKIFKEITQKINQELNSSEGSDFPIQQENLFKLFGEEFPNSALYCNGFLDMKTLSTTKKIESEKTFLHYKNRYNMMLNYARKSANEAGTNFDSNYNYNNENANNQNFREIKKNNNDDLNDEEILRLINEDIDKADDGQNDDFNSLNNDNMFLNKKRNNPDNNKNSDIDDERNVNTSLAQSPQKNLNNMKFLNVNKSNENKVKKDLLDIIKKERNAESNSKNLRLNHYNVEEEKSVSPIKYIV